MSQPLAVYADTLLRETEGSAGDVQLRFHNGLTRRVCFERWVSAADEIDERALGSLRGPVLDVGCGPGRHLHALTRRGVFGLGVDLSPAAVALARGAGANAMVGSIFDELPGTGHWRSALLLDGNIGIGGRPERLLRRIGRLLTGGGQILVELACPDTETVETLVRLETTIAISDWFPWAEVSASDIAELATAAGFAVTMRWNDAGRWFAVLSGGGPACLTADRLGAVVSSALLPA